MKPPPISFDLLNIKTPQLIGIIFGCLVFTATISAVIALLYKSGTLTRFNQEIKSGKELKFPKEMIAPQMAEIPELHDHLILAKKSLPLRLSPPKLEGKFIQIQPLDQKCIRELFEVGNGSAKFDESAYDPERLWGWFPNFIHERPYESFEIFQESLLTSQPINESHLVIVDQKIHRIIGMVSLTKNDPNNLTVQIGRYPFLFTSLSLSPPPLLTSWRQITSGSLLHTKARNILMRPSSSSPSGSWSKVTGLSPPSPLIPFFRISKNLSRDRFAASDWSEIY